ncbi:MAG TPA: ATP-grasp domain-containing protein [Urbifossiella sp.]|nr:ATP-grasp domain-containing protein [Urbifossiella sp.]
MKVFVYEYLTARGLGSDPMYREGRAMRDAVAADLAALPGCEVVTLDNAPDEPAAFAARAATADWSLVIAPEFDGILSTRCRWVLDAGGRLLGPDLAVVTLTADKLALAVHWRAHGVPTPATTDRPPTACEAFPVVWKPRDGCGSSATYLLRDRFELARAVASAEYGGPMILQEFVPGIAASVAVLCGPVGNVPLLPAAQHLSDDGRFHYRGGELPLPPELAARAVALAERAVRCVPGLCGYVGVDLILGDGRDVAVEINPRLTTSYVGVRALAADNLAGEMVRVAAGGVRRPVRWHDGAVRFTSDGTVVRVKSEPG